MCLISFAVLFAVTEDDSVIIIGWRDVKCAAALAQLNAWGNFAGNHFPVWLQSTGESNPDSIPDIAALKSRIMAKVKDLAGTAGTISHHSTVISPNTLAEYGNVKFALGAVAAHRCFEAIADANLPLCHLGVVWDKITRVGGVSQVNFQDDPCPLVNGVEAMKQLFR